LMAVLTAIYVIFLGPAAPMPSARAAVAFVGGLLFCAASFVVVPPLDPKTFDQQRHVLPVLPLLVASLPILVSDALRPPLPVPSGRRVEAAVVGLLVVSVLVVARFRYPTLSNDARNVDDVQVGLARQLESLNRDEVVWAVDAGAVRYFGRAFVVDLLGRDGADARRFVDTRRPAYIEMVPAWSSLDAAS